MDRITTQGAMPAARLTPDPANAGTSIPGDARSLSRSAYTSGAQGALQSLAAGGTPTGPWGSSRTVSASCPMPRSSVGPIAKWTIGAGSFGAELWRSYPESCAPTKAISPRALWAIESLSPAMNNNEGLQHWIDESKSKSPCSARLFQYRPAPFLTEIVQVSRICGDLHGFVHNS